MAYEFKLPDLGEGLSEGEIARWLVAEGQEIAEDDPLVEIATDKTTVEIPSPAGGVVTRILVAEGEVVPVGTVLVVIGGDGAEAAAAEPRCPRRRPRSGGPRLPGQVTERVTREGSGRRRSCAGSLPGSGSISRRSPGTGPQGRITEEDVAAAAADSRGRDPVPRPDETRSPRAAARHPPADVPAPDPGPPRDPRRHLGRGVRLHRRRPEAAAPARAPGRRRVAARVPRAERERRRRGARLPRPDRRRRRRPDRAGARRPGRPRLRRARTRRARRGGAPARRGRARRAARARGAPRRHVHRHERGTLGRALRHAARQPSRGGDPRHPPDRGARRRPRRRDRRAGGWATSRSRSTTA